jgi:hypothetical protein
VEIKLKDHQVEVGPAGEDCSLMGWPNGMWEKWDQQPAD